MMVPKWCQNRRNLSLRTLAATVCVALKTQQEQYGIWHRIPVHTTRWGEYPQKFTFQETVPFTNAVTIARTPRPSYTAHSYETTSTAKKIKQPYRRLHNWTEMWFSSMVKKRIRMPAGDAVGIHIAHSLRNAKLSLSQD